MPISEASTSQTLVAQMSAKHAYKVTALARSASVAEAINAHWKRVPDLGYGTRCIHAQYVHLWHLDLQQPIATQLTCSISVFESSLMGIAMAITTFLIIL